MRVLKDKKVEKIYCNQCGRKIEVENEMAKEGVLSVDYEWAYFSRKDGMKHSFDLCEQCYDEMVGKFIYPVFETECTELI